VLRLRPGLHDFLNALESYYELVVFTAATQDYADPILDAIESDKKYFDLRLYRQHAIIIDNDFVKVSYYLNIRTYQNLGGIYRKLSLLIICHKILNYKRKMEFS
jgi:TFIIF-interacting CTD phosphatase-like protein